MCFIIVSRIGFDFLLRANNSSARGSHGTGHSARYRGGSDDIMARQVHQVIDKFHHRCWLCGTSENLTRAHILAGNDDGQDNEDVEQMLDLVRNPKYAVEPEQLFAFSHYRNLICLCGTDGVATSCHHKFEHFQCVIIYISLEQRFYAYWHDEAGIPPGKPRYYALAEIDMVPFRRALYVHAKTAELYYPDKLTPAYKEHINEVAVMNTRSYVGAEGQAENDGASTSSATSARSKGTNVDLCTRPHLDLWTPPHVCTYCTCMYVKMIRIYRICVH